MKRRLTKRKYVYDSDPSSATAGEAALDWVVACGVSDRVMLEVEAEVRRRRRRRLAAAVGGITALVIAGLLLPWGTPGKREPWPAVAGASSAAVFAPARRILPDGSVVELKNGAGITLAFSEAIRRITLEQGEAHFQVAANPARPFIVSARGIETRAVGTAFSVELGASTVEVLVTEGEVETCVVISNRHEDAGGAPLPPPAPTFVAAGNRVVIELGGAAAIVAPVQPLTVPEMERKLSWRIPRLEFAGTPLHEVVRLFHQHSGTRIILGDSTLGRLQLSGVLRADNTDSLLRLLELEFGIKAERRGELEIVLRRH